MAVDQRTGKCGEDFVDNSKLVTWLRRRTDFSQGRRCGLVDNYVRVGVGWVSFAYRLRVSTLSYPLLLVAQCGAVVVPTKNSSSESGLLHD
jgi:hypothetical protein